MKKYLILLLISLIAFLIISNEPPSSFVFNENDSEYSMYIIEFSSKNVSTNNLENLFKDIKIIWVKPFINSLYSSKLGYKNYYFEDISFKQNVNKFKSNYLSVLNKNGFKVDAINYELVGIPIDKIKVYCTKSDILSLNIDGIKYRKSY